MLRGICSRCTALHPYTNVYSTYSTVGYATNFALRVCVHVISQVTNFHVLQSALATLPRRPGGLPRAGQEGPKPLVAKVTLLGAPPPDEPQTDAW